MEAVSLTMVIGGYGYNFQFAPQPWQAIAQLFCSIGIFETFIKAEEDKMPYIFQSVKDTEKLTDSSKLYNFIEGFADYKNQFFLIYGKIKALFGQPIYETENLGNLFYTAF